jgi:hypothetical protein
MIDILRPGAERDFGIKIAYCPYLPSIVGKRRGDQTSLLPGRVRSARELFDLFKLGRDAPTR